MLQFDKNEDQLGVVLVWNARPQVGRYGYVTPIRRTEFEDCVLYFDEKSLASSEEPMAEGVLVHYQVDMAEGRPKLFNVRVEYFFSHDYRLDFSEGDIFRFKGLVHKLNDPTTAIMGYLREKLSPENQKFMAGERDLMRRDGIEMMLAEHFNSIIGGPLIYEKALFADIELRSLTKKFLSQNPQNSKLLFLNRLLLEDALASEIPGQDPLPDCTKPIAAEIVDLGDDNAGKLKLESGSANFFFHFFPADSFIPAIGTKVQCRVLILSYDGLIFAYDIWEASAVLGSTDLSTGSSPDVSEAKTDQTPLINSGLVYDVGNGRMLLPNNKRVAVSPRYALVLNAMMKRVPGKLPASLARSRTEEQRCFYGIAPIRLGKRWLVQCATVPSQRAGSGLLRDALFAMARELVESHQ